MIKLLIWSVLIIYMLIIFGLSAQEAFKSHSLSTSIAGKISPYIMKIESWLGLETTPVPQLNYRLRKLTHFFEYFLLAVLLFIALSFLQMKYRLKIAVVLIICIIYAVFDEIHQLFVPGRAPGIKDIFIDSSGAVLAVLLIYMIRLLKGRAH